MSRMSTILSGIRPKAGRLALGMILAGFLAFPGFAASGRPGAAPAPSLRMVTSGTRYRLQWHPYQDRFALVVMGGHVSGNPYYRWYWNDTYGMVRHLRAHGFTDDCIRYLSYGDSVPNHPGEVDGLSTTQGIRDAYAWARSQSDANDLFYIFWVDHGSTTSFDTYDGTITHAELGALTDLIQAKCVAGAYNPCYSGAVVDDLSRPGVFTTTSQDAGHTNSWGWAGVWRVALAGGNPGDSSDGDGDGVVSFTEAYSWLCPQSQNAGEHPMIDDNGDSIGHECGNPGFDPQNPVSDGYFGRLHSLDGWSDAASAVEGTGPAQRAEPVLRIAGTPNPFLDATFLRFFLPAASEVRVDLFRADGSRVLSLHQGTLAQGFHSLAWDGVDVDGRRLSRGIYLVRIDAGGRHGNLRLCCLR
jgi:hypothetical protein